MNNIFTRKTAKSIFMGVTLVTLATFASTTFAAPKSSVDASGDLSKAQSTVKNFKLVIQEFFNKSNTESLATHIGKLASIVSAVNNLTKEAQAKYNKTKSAKYKVFLDVLTMIKKSVHEIYQALKKPHSTAIGLAFSLGKVMKKHASSSHLATLNVHFKKLKGHLTSTEKNILADIVDTLETIAKVVPKSKVVCLARLNKIWKRK